MGLTKYKLGELIELCTRTNENLCYGTDDVRGVNNLKQFMPTKVDLNGRDLSKFQIVNSGNFVFNHRTSRNGSKFSIAYNDTNDVVICTEDYVVFRIKENAQSLLDADWLYMFFNRSEFDRYVITNSWGSSTEFYNWEDIKSVEIELPSLEIQKKYVAVYKAMVENQRAYERGLDDLKLVCDGYIEDLRRNMPCEEIGKYIGQCKEKNTSKEIKNVFGVSTTKQFIKASSSVDTDNLLGYKIVEFGYIAYVPTTHMKVYAIAISNHNQPFVISPIYEVFRVKDSAVLNPWYLFLWLCRNETIRYAYYNSWGSARENFIYSDMCTIKIPIPKIEIQNDIVNIYKSYEKRKEIAEKLKAQIKDICPILIKGSLDEARKEAQ